MCPTEFLRQYIDRPTRKDVVLDLISGNIADQVEEVSIGELFKDSDHNS